jgi:iron(III) transport system substrate-binding protein
MSMASHCKWIGSRPLQHIAVLASGVFASLCALFSNIVCAQVAAQSAEWAQVVSMAQKEGRVVVYGSPHPAVYARLKADFEKAYPGIVWELTRISGAPVIPKVESERSTGADGADVAIFGERGWFEERAKEGALKALPGPAAKQWPPEYSILGVAPVLTIQPNVIAYNTNLVKTEITGYQDLLRPEFKGKIGSTDIISTGILAWYEWLEKTQGPDFLTKFAAQRPIALFNGSVPVASALASGEIAVAAFTLRGAAQPLIDRGAPIKIVVPNPRGASTEFGAVFSWAKRPNAGLVLIDYLISARGQTVLVGQGEFASPLPNIPGSLDIKTTTSWDLTKYPPSVANAYAERWRKIIHGR